MKYIDPAFITEASNILAATDSPLSNSKIETMCSDYAMKFDAIIPQDRMKIKAPNKRTLLKEYLKAFKPVEQFTIIKELCDNPLLKDRTEVKTLKQILYSRYGEMDSANITNNELIQTTKHWLLKYPEALKEYEAALEKFNRCLYDRNILDDMRLSLELLIKKILNKEKSLENQIKEIGSFLQKGHISVELRNMFQPIIKFYTDFQNQHVKHNNLIDRKEIEFIINLTSVMMKFLITVAGEPDNE